MKTAFILTQILLGASMSNATLAERAKNYNGNIPHPREYYSLERVPRNAVRCPSRVKQGRYGPYNEQIYTSDQILAILNEAAQIGSEHATVGTGEKFPHNINYDKQLVFSCGKDKMVFPILPDRLYEGFTPTDNVPDRVVFEYKQVGKTFKVWYCGVVRHDLNKGFIPCAA